MMWNKLNRLTKVAGLGDGSSKEISKAISLRDFNELETLVQQTPARLNDRVTKNKGTLLTEAIRTEDEELARWLVKHGADLNLQTRRGATALLFACKGKQLSVVELLVEHKAKLDIGTVDGTTALMVACCSGESDTVRLLIEHGAQLDLQDCEGRTALIHAIESEDVKIARMLIEKGEKLDIKDKRGRTALQCACSGDHSELLVPLLISRGADINLQEEKGLTALMLACMRGNTEAARLLIEAGAKLELQTCDGCTALHHAIRHNNLEVACLLIEKGIDLNIRTNGGCTALHLASDRGHTELVRLLVSRDAKLNLQEKGGFTALMGACLRGDSATAQVLIESNANVALRTSDNKWSALLLACQGQRSSPTAKASSLQCVKLCWAAGAHLKTNRMGYNAASSVASYWKRTDILEFLNFVTKSKVVTMLLRDLRQPRQLVLRFFEEGVVKREACKALHEEDLERMGVTGALQRRLILQRFNRTAPLLVSPSKLVPSLKMPSAPSSPVSQCSPSTPSSPMGQMPSTPSSPMGQVPSAPSSTMGQQIYSAPDYSATQDQIVEDMPVEIPGYPMYPPMCSPESPPIPNWSSLERDASTSTTISGCQSRSISAAASSSPSEKPATAGEEKLFDAFLSHSWGEDETNHELVRSINEALCNADVKTWFDGERVTDNIRQEIARGIGQSHKAVIFITSEYMAKLDSDDSNFCKEEFQAAANMLKPKNMIPVILESSLLDPGSWLGLLQLQLGSKLYVDFSTPEKRQNNMDHLIECIKPKN